MGVSWKKDERSPPVDVDLCETCEQHICKDCALRDSLQDRMDRLKECWAELRRRVEAENPMHGCFADITDWMDELENE